MKVDSTKEVAKMPRWVSAAAFGKYTEARAGMIGKTDKNSTILKCQIYTSERSYDDHDLMMKHTTLI